MLDDVTVLVLGTEHDNAGVLVYMYVVSRGPVEQIVLPNGLLSALCIRRGDLTLQNIAPVRTLAEVAV